MFPGYLILSLGPPLTQLGLWREARILIRPSSALHRRQSRTVSLRQCSLSKQQNKSGGTSGLCSFYLSLTYCCGSTDGSRATSISANDDKWAGWWNFMMTVLRCENKRGVYVQRFLWDFGGKSDYKWIYSTYCPQPPLKTISLRKLSCALFVNEVKTTGAQAHCWHLVCGALLVFSGDGEWEKAAEAITNLHSHKRASKDSFWTSLFRSLYTLQTFTQVLAPCRGGWWSVGPPSRCRSADMPARTAASSILKFKSSTGFPNPLGTLL